MRTILVTGSTGFLGSHIIKELIKNDENYIIAIGGRPEDVVNTLPQSPRIELHNIDDLFTKDFTNIETIINCAFARSGNSELLASSLKFTSRAINRFKTLHVKSVINISTQGVYKRLNPGELSNEKSPIAPIDMYSMAKYAVEEMFNISNIPSITNVRLSSLMMPQRFLYHFVKKAKSGESFLVTAPKQYASIMDVKDAASGIVAVANLDPDKRNCIFNIGTGVQHSLLEYAETVKMIGNSLGLSVFFDINDNGTNSCAGMDCSLITQATGWEPIYYKDLMIQNLFKEI